jgi:chlorophyllide a oxygenase
MTGVLHCRYAAAFSSKLKSDTLVPIELFGQPWVLFRDQKGHAACVRDECAHRACPLSAGSVVEGQVQCPYHGWTFNSQGECTKMPSTVQCKGVKVSHLQTVERDGLVWIWPGDGKPVDVPSNTLPPGSFTLHSEIEVRTSPHCLPLSNSESWLFTVPVMSMSLGCETPCALQH